MFKKQLTDVTSRGQFLRQARLNLTRVHSTTKRLFTAHCRILKWARIAQTHSSFLGVRWNSYEASDKKWSVWNELLLRPAFREKWTSEFQSVCSENKIVLERNDWDSQLSKFHSEVFILSQTRFAKKKDKTCSCVQFFIFFQKNKIVLSSNFRVSFEMRAYSGKVFDRVPDSQTLLSDNAAMSRRVVILKTPGSWVRINDFCPSAREPNEWSVLLWIA